MAKSSCHLGNMGQQLRFREAYYRVNASFRVRGVARVHSDVGAARLAGIAEPNEPTWLQWPVAAVSLEEHRTYVRPRDHQRLAR